MARKRMFKNATRICTVFPEAELEQIQEHAEKNGANRSQLILDAVAMSIIELLKNKTSPIEVVV